jgi:hypothetical protein
METKQLPKIICEKTVTGVTAVRNITTPTANQRAFVASIVGAGNAYWWFNAIPAGKVFGCDFTNAPIASVDAAENNAAIASISMQPGDVLIYE